MPSVRPVERVVVMAAALVWTHLDGSTHSLSLSGELQAIVGLAAGFAIGAVAAVMGSSEASC